MPSTDPKNIIAATITIVALAACSPAGAGDVLGAGLLPDQPADDDDESTDESDETTEGDEPPLDLGGAGDGDGDDEELPEDPEPVAECTTHDDCVALDSECSLGICGPGGQCEQLAMNEGAPCASDDLCVEISTCSAGACVGGQALDCAAFDGECSVGACDPETGSCVALAVDGCELEPEPEPEPDPECPIGSQGCPCTMGGACDPGLTCSDNSTCQAPAELCEGLIAPLISYPTNDAPMEIVAVQVDGPMADANIAATCEACGLAPLCGSVENTDPCNVGYSEVYNGPTRKCCKNNSCYIADRNWHDDTCVQLPEPEPQNAGASSHWLIARELGCPSPLACEALLGAWVVAADNNQHWESLGGGQVVEWIVDGPVGIELWGGYVANSNTGLPVGQYPVQPTWVDGYGHSWPNHDDYADRRALCVSP